MSDAVSPGELSPQRLDAIANGAEQHPPMKLNLGPQAALALCMQDTVIGALENAARAAGVFGLKEEQTIFTDMAQFLSKRGKELINAATRRIVVPEIVTP